MDKLLLSFCILFVLTGLLHSLDCKKAYVKIDEDFNKTRRGLQLLARKLDYTKPIIINNFNFDYSFPSDPLEIIPQQSALFLNFFYFSAYDFYQLAWKETCHCDPLSLTEKVDYIVSSESIFLVEEETFRFMQKYFREKYHLSLEKKDIGKFRELKICQLRYGNNSSYPN